MGMQSISQTLAATLMPEVSRKGAKQVADIGARAFARIDAEGFKKLDRSAVKEVAAFNAPILAKYPDLLKLKYERMSLNAFSFFRGTDHLFYHDMQRIEGKAINAGPKTILQGDLHPNNFGTMSDAAGRVHLAPNDFDEAYAGSVRLDLKRMATGLYLAADQVGFAPHESRELVDRMARTYHQTMKRLIDHPMTMADVPQPEIVRHLLDHADHVDPAKWLDQVAPLKNGKRMILRKPDTSTSITPQVFADLKDGYSRYLKANPELASELGSYRVTDAVSAVAGTGSVGRARYHLLLESDAGKPARVLEFKEEVPAAMAPYVDRVAGFDSQAARFMNGSTWMEGAQNRLMGQVDMPMRDALESQSFLVREVLPSKAAIDVTTIKDPKQMMQLADYYATEMAVGHAAGEKAGLAGAAQIYASLGGERHFGQEMSQFGQLYGQQVQRDFKQFKTAIAKDPLLRHVAIPSVAKVLGPQAS